jgi:hypothetical protein
MSGGVRWPLPVAPTVADDIAASTIDRRPGPTVDQFRQIAAILIENGALHRGHADVQLGDACMAVGLHLQRKARELADEAKKPKRTRLMTPRDRRKAEVRAQVFMLKLREQCSGKIPSLRAARKAADEARVAPRDLVDAAYRAEFILDAPAEE